MNKTVKIAVALFVLANIVWYIGFYKPLEDRKNQLYKEIQTYQQNYVGNLDILIKKTLRLRDSLKNEISIKMEKTENINDIGRIERKFRRYCKRYGVSCNGFKPQYEMFYKLQQEKPEEKLLPLFILTSLEGKFSSVLKVMENLENFESLIYPSFYLNAEQSSGKENRVSTQIMLSLMIRKK